MDRRKGFWDLRRILKEVEYRVYVIIINWKESREFFSLFIFDGGNSVY